MASLLDKIRRANRPPFHTQSVAEARASYISAAEVLEPPRAPLARVEELHIPADDGTPLPARLYVPTNDRHLPALLYTHGGGFTIGNLETHDSLMRQIALRSNAAVLALDYRLAPEHRFPVAVDDTWAALRWLAQHAETLGLDGTRLAVGGDSAGGTLAAAAAIHARDIGLHLRLQVLITPGTTAYADTPSHRTYAHGFLLDAETIAWFFDQYIAHEQRRDWRFAPLEANDLDGVAPACVVLAECDPLVDEGVAYADRLRAAGVEVELELVRGMTHDFIKMGRVLPEAGAAQALIGAALQKAFATMEADAT
ncbi:MAG TPA: alpha/beta hydrolase [Burkholderiaceae bacterium]